MSRGFAAGPTKQCGFRALAVVTVLALGGSISAAGVAYGATSPSRTNTAPAAAGEASSPNAAPTFSSPGLTKLVGDYRSHRLSSEQFVAYSLGTLFGGGLPPAYADSAPGAITNTDQSTLLDYAFAAAGHLPAAEQSALADAFAPTATAGTQIQPMQRNAPTLATASGARTMTSAPAISAVPAITHAATSASPYCQGHPLRIGLPPVLHLGFALKPVTFRCEAATAHFNIFYSLSSQDGQNGVDDTDLWGGIDGAGNAIPDGVPDYIDNVALSLEDAYGYYSSLGYTEPQTPVGVLVSSFNGQMNPGNAFTPPPIGKTQLIAMSNVRTEIYIPHHEVFHTFQYPYISDQKLIENFGEMNWWMEATGEWAAHQSMSHSTGYWADGQGNSEEAGYAEKLPAFLGTPSLPLSDYEGLGAARQYGAFIFAEYLSQVYGAQSILQSWQHVGGGAWPVEAISDALADNGTSFDQVMPDFAKAVYQLGDDGSGYWTCVPGTGSVINPYGLTPPDCGPYAHPVYVPGVDGGYDSTGYQFDEVSCASGQCVDDLPAWIGNLGQDSRTNSSASDDPARYAPRPAHDVIPAVDADTHTEAIAAGGMYFADLTGSFGYNQSLQVTVDNPVDYGLHASLISWTQYHVRCGNDRDADVPAFGSVSLQGPSLGGCAYSTLVLTDTTPADGAGLSLPATWSSQVLTTASNRVLVFGGGDYGWSAPNDWATQTLTAAGYDVDESPTLPADLSSYGAIFYISTDALSSADQDALQGFTEAGGGLYLTGERPCCEALNASDTALISQILTPDAANGVQIGGIGDVYYATGALPVNPNAIDGLATTPDTATSVTVSAPGGIAGVTGDNVLAATSLTNGAPIAAVWDGTDVAGGGRVVVFMDINWLEPSWYGNTATATPLLDNIATFLTGTPASPQPISPQPIYAASTLAPAVSNTHPPTPSAAQ